MKKREKKLQLHRETVLRLEDRPAALAVIRGGEVAPLETDRWSSCGQPNCCPETLNTCNF